MPGIGRLTTLFILILSSSIAAAVKPQFGGNLKVAEELLAGLNAQTLFSTSGSSPKPLYPVSYTLEANRLTLDLTSLSPDVFTEVEKSLLAIQNPDHPCHWVLDYPFAGHRHATIIEAADGKVQIRAESPETLLVLLDSSCLLPEPVEAFQPFTKTQFGYEANPACMAGRPFLDSITPAPVDSANPYLSFKLNDADIIPIPEDRFQLISRDPDLRLISGPGYFVFLKTEGLNPETVAAVSSAIRLAELLRAVLNGHAEPLLNYAPALPPKPGTRIHLTYPREAPYRLIGERIEIDLREAGFEISSSGQNLKMEVYPVRTKNEDLMRYLVLRRYFEETTSDESAAWFEIWDQYEASGRILPLFLHTTMLAVRQGIQNLHPGPSGTPDFSNAWLEPQP